MPVMVSVVVKRTAYQVICRKPVLFSWISKLLSGFSLLKSFAFLISPNWHPKLSVKERGGFFFLQPQVYACARGLRFTHFRLAKNSDFKKRHHSWHRTFLPWERKRERISSQWQTINERVERTRAAGTRTHGFDKLKKKHTHTAFTLALVWYTHAGKLHSRRMLCSGGWYKN